MWLSVNWFSVAPEGNYCIILRKITKFKYNLQVNETQQENQSGEGSNIAYECEIQICIEHLWKLFIITFMLSWYPVSQLSCITVISGQSATLLHLSANIFENGVKTVGQNPPSFFSFRHLHLRRVGWTHNYFDLVTFCTLYTGRSDCARCKAEENLAWDLWDLWIQKILISIYLY